MLSRMTWDAKVKIIGNFGDTPGGLPYASRPKRQWYRWFDMHRSSGSPTVQNGIAYVLCLDRGVLDAHPLFRPKSRGCGPWSLSDVRVYLSRAHGLQHLKIQMSSSNYVLRKDHSAALGCASSWF